MDNVLVFSLALAGILNSISIIKINNKIHDVQCVIGYLSEVIVDKKLQENLEKDLKKIKESK